MTGSTVSLLLAAAGLTGVAIFAVVHRRDAFGGIAGITIGFSAVATGLVGFAASTPSPTAAAQIQAFAVVAEIVGVLCAAVGATLAAVLWRRSGADLLTELKLATASAGESAGEMVAERPDPGENAPGGPGESAADEAAPAEDIDDGAGTAGEVGDAHL